MPSTSCVKRKPFNYLSESELSAYIDRAATDDRATAVNGRQFWPAGNPSIDTVGEPAIITV
ncbi:hypothetical protein [Hafnia paralvei]|uniref:hypothetical protein n=1 Tax=Hafnia paralvei TaxID=546367 RepID=UPI00187D488D|nr:hypothetical protein [Hafnia paralvei]MCE9948012.1 hypothetical protein [Hafnia paralvei]